MMLDAKLTPRFLLEMVVHEAKRAIQREVACFIIGWMYGFRDTPAHRFGAWLERVTSQ